MEWVWWDGAWPTQGPQLAGVLPRTRAEVDLSPRQRAPGSFPLVTQHLPFV